MAHLDSVSARGPLAGGLLADVGFLSACGFLADVGSLSTWGFLADTQTVYG